MSYDENDPFAGADKSPAISFADQPVDTVHHIDVSEPARKVQQRNFDTDEPDFWPPNKDGSPGKPKYAAVYNGVDENGENRSLWAPIPSDLFAKLSKHEEAYRAKGAPIGGGNTVERISVKLTGRVPAKNPKYNKNTYATKVESIGPKVADTAPEADPFASDEPPF